MPETLTPQQISDALKNLPGWAFEDERLVKTYKFDHFRAAMAFIVRLSYEAEQRNHHPELSNVYNTVMIKLNTHDVGGTVTEKDVDLARAIEAVA